MRTGIAIAILILSASMNFAQTGTTPAHGDVLIVKYDWSKERINWTGDPLSVPNESYNEMRDRVRTERRGQGTALQQRANRDAQQERKAQKEQRRSANPPRYVFRYLLTVHNTGPKDIVEIDWDYVFSDEKTGENLGTHEFTSVEKIGAGRKKVLSIRASAPPTQTISAHALGSDERSGLVGRVMILRILYEDGTVWTRAN